MDDLERTRPAPVELKAVDPERRLVEAYASVFNVIDKQGDLIEPGAFAACLAEKKLSDISVLIAHRTDHLPIGQPLAISEDEFGLLTITRVFPSPSGDDLLAAAKELLAVGGSLGLSIGYRPVDYSWRRDAGGTPVRHLKAVDLCEYSFLASPALAANPLAVVVGVKQAPATLADRLAQIAEQEAWLAAAREREFINAKMRRERRALQLKRLDPLAALDLEESETRERVRARLQAALPDIDWPRHLEGER